MNVYYVMFWLITIVEFYEVVNFNFHFVSYVINIKYRKVKSSNASRLEPHPSFYRLLNMKTIFDAYVLRPFGKKFTIAKSY